MEYLSYSRLTLLETCGLRFYYEYVEQTAPQDEVVTYHASFGRLVHSLYEAHARSAGELQFADLKRDYDPGFLKILPEFPDRETAASFYRSGLSAVHRFSRYRVADVVASEREFTVEVTPDAPPVRGYIDRLILSPDHGYIVADLKTGRPFSGRDPRKNRQLAIYSTACEADFGEAADSGYFDFAARGTREWVNISAEDRRMAGEWVGQKWAQIQRGEFAPRYSAGFCASYCPYRSRCPEFQARQAFGKATSESAAAASADRSGGGGRVEGRERRGRE